PAARTENTVFYRALFRSTTAFLCTFPTVSWPLPQRNRKAQRLRGRADAELHPLLMLDGPSRSSDGGGKVVHRSNDVFLLVVQMVLQECYKRRQHHLRFLGISVAHHGNSRPNSRDQIGDHRVLLPQPF